MKRNKKKEKRKRGIEWNKRLANLTRESPQYVTGDDGTANTTSSHQDIQKIGRPPLRCGTLYYTEPLPGGAVAEAAAFVSGSMLLSAVGDSPMLGASADLGSSRFDVEVVFKDVRTDGRLAAAFRLLV